MLCPTSTVFFGGGPSIFKIAAIAFAPPLITERARCPAWDPSTHSHAHHRFSTDWARCPAWSRRHIHTHTTVFTPIGPVAPHGDVDTFTRTPPFSTDWARCPAWSRRHNRVRDAAHAVTAHPSAAQCYPARFPSHMYEHSQVRDAKGCGLRSPLRRPGLAATKNQAPPARAGGSGRTRRGSSEIRGSVCSVRRRD